MIGVKKATRQSYIVWLCVLSFWGRNPGPHEYKHKSSPTRQHPCLPIRLFFCWEHTSVLIPGFFKKGSQNLCFFFFLLIFCKNQFSLFYIHSVLYIYKIKFWWVCWIVIILYSCVNVTKTKPEYSQPCPSLLPNSLSQAAAICLLSSWSCLFWNVIATSSQHTAFVLSFLHSACLWDSVVLPNVLMFDSL